MAKLVIQAHEGADRDDTAIRWFLEGVPIFHLLGVKAMHFEAGKVELELSWRQDLTHDARRSPLPYQPPGWILLAVRRWRRRYLEVGA